MKQPGAGKDEKINTKESQKSQGDEIGIPRKIEFYNLKGRASSMPENVHVPMDTAVSSILGEQEKVMAVDKC
ncbi:unnamed protein product [Linum trigynum]|uniref:Uncharacterized protein n=1 Tax=Linum trigynum TaxID=586398 RepID=A0AAV2CVH1_9ROSI